MVAHAAHQIFWLCTLQAFSSAALQYVGNVTASPSESQLRWHSYEVGVMITFNLQTWCLQKGANASQQECQKGTNLGPLYVPSWEAVQALNPSHLDTDSWLAAASSFGARYSVLVVDHMTGFTLWPTTLHNFSVASTQWRGGRGDVVQDFMASSLKYDIAPGLFYSTHYNWYLGVNEYSVGWPRLYGGPSLSQAQYEDVVLAQLQELAGYTQPGWQEVWFDGGVNTVLTPRVGPAVRSMFPTAVCHSCFNFTQAGGPGSGGQGNGYGLRWMGNEEGVMPLPSWGATVGDGSGPFGGYATGPVYLPPSCDTVLSEHYWFWQPESEGYLRSTCDLVNVYLTSVGRAANLILNMAPNTTGGLAPADVSAYASFGSALSCLWSKPLGEVANMSVEGQGAGFVDIAWPSPIQGQENGEGVTSWDLSVHLQEEIASTGQRMGNWTLQACAGGWAGGGCAGAWVNALLQAPVQATSSIGHKRILRAQFSASLEAPFITGFRFTLLSGYAWRPVSESRSTAVDPPFTLARVAVYDWSEAVGQCVPQSCTLASY